MTGKDIGRSNRLTSRRNVLKSVGVTGLTLTSTNIVQGIHPGASDVVVVKGNPSDPITERQRKRAFQAAVESYRDRGGTQRTFLTPGATASSVPSHQAESDISESDDVGTEPEEMPNVVHVVRISADGRTSTYDGFARDERSVARRYERASEFQRAWENDTTTQDITTQDSWDAEGDAYVDNGEDPYGEVTNYTELKLYDDNFLHRQSQGLTPGVIAYDSSWENHTNGVAHDWGLCELQNSDLASWEPSFEPCGETSTTLTLDKTGPAVSWSYSQDDVCITDSSDTTDDIVNLIWDYNSGAAKTSSQNYETGSELFTDGAASCDSYRILDAESLAMWEDCSYFTGCDYTDWYIATINWSSNQC